MKKFTKYFGGEYMKYWYIAFVVILIAMIISMVNDTSYLNDAYTIGYPQEENKLSPN